MKAYLAIKFREDMSNKKLIEEISKSLEKAGLDVVALVRDYENWGEVKFSPQELMKLAFKLIIESDFVILEFSEKGVGLGVEAGYAFAKGIPIIVIAREGSDVSNTIRGISQKIIFYNEPQDLIELRRNIFKEL